MAIHTEVSLLPLYTNQPVFGEIDLAMREMGFIPHMFAHLSKRMILPLHNAGDPYMSLNQVFEADVVYVRDFTFPDKMSPEQLKQLALVAHHCYASYDLAANCIHHLAERGALPADAGRYGAELEKIAARLFVSKVTVQNYTSAIYSKLGVTTRAKAILYAIQHGLVEPGP